MLVFGDVYRIVEINKIEMARLTIYEGSQKQQSRTDKKVGAVEDRRRRAMGVFHI